MTTLPRVTERGAMRALACRAGLALAGCLGLFMLEPPRSSADEISWMFNPDAVVEMNIGGISEAELDELEAAPDEYVKGTFELKVDGVPQGAPLVDVGVRRKGGFGSSRPIKTGKSGLKIRFDEFVKGQIFFGIKRLTLNNMFQDESMLHETLTYELFHGLDLPASRTGYAFVNLNGEKYGLFLNVETLDEISLPQWFPTTGHLYEADASGVDVRPGEAGTYEVDEGDDEDLSDLEALIAAANDEEGDWSDGMDQVADLERMTAQWAVERYVDHWDGYAGRPLETPEPIRPNNYYLHSDAAGIFQLMPWGTDQTWESVGLEFDAPASGLMVDKCLADASCKELFLDGLTDIHCLNLELDQVAHAAQLASMLEPYQDEEDPVRRGYTAEAIAEEVENVEFVAKRRAEQLVEYLELEGRLGGELDPCAPPPEPETPKQPDSTDSTPPVQTTPIIGLLSKLSIGPSKLQGNLVATRLTTPGAGVATQRVTARFDGRRVQVCADREAPSAAGGLTLRCRLSERAREARASGPLKLRVRVGFAPADAPSRFAVRSLSAPKRP